MEQISQTWSTGCFSLSIYIVRLIRNRLILSAWRACVVWDYFKKLEGEVYSCQLRKDLEPQLTFWAAMVRWVWMLMDPVYSQNQETPGFLGFQLIIYRMTPSLWRCALMGLLYASGNQEGYWNEVFLEPVGAQVPLQYGHRLGLNLRNSDYSEISLQLRVSYWVHI